MTHWPWIIVALLWCLTTHAILQADQGLYEDSNYVNGMSQTPAPPVMAVRGLARWTLWYQINHGLTPRAIRLGNVAFGTLAAILTGVLASQLGLWAWLATGIMVVHPISVETLALMSGRFELIAACGLLLALTVPWALALPLIAIGLGGKETAAIGIALVPLCGYLSTRHRVWAVVACVGTLIVGVVALQSRHVGLTPMIPQVSEWDWARLQGAAAWRLITLLVLPIHQTLDFDYDALARIWTWAACLCLTTVAYLAWTLRQRAAILSACLAWMLLVSAPRLIVQTPKSYLNEHQMYLALPAFALLVCALMHAWSGESCATV